MNHREITDYLDSYTQATFVHIRTFFHLNHDHWLSITLNGESNPVSHGFFSFWNFAFIVKFIH